PFGRIGGTEERGTGLGLPLTRALVELHGGRFTLESAPGQGTTARFTLPDAATTVDAAAATNAAA
ncbi:MAG TPA: ATP-binding protein, partial [Roseomonas sp.]